MPRIDTLRDLFAHHDWAMDKLLAVAAGLSDAQLDQPFDMGPGSLRATLNHVWSAERVWLDRLVGAANPRFRAKADGVSIAQLTGEFRDTTAERNLLIVQQSDATLQGDVRYNNLRGEPMTNAFGDLLLHVYNHGVHHRAQMVNMLRRLSVKSPEPGLDYIFYRIARWREGASPAIVDLATARDYLSYADWAQGQVLAVAVELSDEQLDRSFEMGLGTIRKTLQHIRAAEQWWLENWLIGCDNPFPESPDALPVRELAAITAETARMRNLLVARSSESDLQRIITITPRPGVTRSFAIGETMVQICCHGTLHRAQVLNMFRQVGARVPGLDLVIKVRAAK